MRKSYLTMPAPARVSRPRYAATLAAGALLAPVYWALAHRYGTPGLALRGAAARLAARAATRWPRELSKLELYRILFDPIDSVRYFEFDFAWRATARAAPVRSYLDVSSPRLFPALVLAAHGELTADLLNPDAPDLAHTRHLLGAFGLLDRVRLHGHLIADAALAPERFDVITSISVVEHIPDDRSAVEAMWALVRPGGTLILTVPCAAERFEEHSPRNEYGLYAPDRDGYVFYQRVYDSALLAERILSVTGAPAASEVYGERRRGFYADHLRPAKLGDASYPFWQEPCMLGREYRRFDSVDELPGWGVVGLAFTKPAVSPERNDA